MNQLNKDDVDVKLPTLEELKSKVAAITNESYGTVIKSSVMHFKDNLYTVNLTKGINSVFNPSYFNSLKDDLIAKLPKEWIDSIVVGTGGATEGLIVIRLKKTKEEQDLQDLKAHYVSHIRNTDFEREGKNEAYYRKQKFLDIVKNFTGKTEEELRDNLDEEGLAVDMYERHKSLDANQLKANQMLSDALDKVAQQRAQEKAKPIYERSDEELFSPGKKYINVSHKTEMVIDYLNDPMGNGGTVYLKSGSRIDRKDFINYLKIGSVMELESYQEKQKAKTEAFKNLDAVKLFKKYKIDDVRGWDKQGKRSRVWTTHSDNLSDNKKIVQALNLIPEFEKMGYSVSVKQSHYESKPDSSEVQSEREYSYGKGSNVDITLTKDGKTIELSGSQPYTIDGKKSDGYVSTGGLYNDEELKKFLFSNFVL